MTIIGCLILLIWMGLLPVAVGAIPTATMDKKQRSMGFAWISGYVLLWAVFQVLCVGVLLIERFWFKGTLFDSFSYVVTVFSVIGVILAGIGMVIIGLLHKKKEKLFLLEKAEHNKSKTEIVFWVLFAVLLAVQIVCALLMRYADGDDSYYVAISTITESSNTMYKVYPYSMGDTELDLRHSLAPFPIWIAFLSRISGCHASFVAHVVVSVTLIIMSYVIFGQVGRLLLEENRESLPIFMCFAALLVIFGDYSIYTPENFMIARSRQGKAALGNIIIPMVILLFLLIFQRYKEGKKTEWTIWILLGATVTTACLCSTLGTFLISLFLGVMGLCTGVVYKKWEPVWKTALCCSPAVLYAVLYFVIS